VEAHTRTPDHGLAHLGVAGVVLVVCTLLASNGVPDWEDSVFRAVHDLPDWLEPVLWAPMQLGSLLAPGLVAAVSWIAWGRWRPTVGAIVVGIGGWLLAQVIKAQVDRDRPYSLLDGVTWRAGAPRDGLGFLSGHATVAFALTAVVSPYLTRPQRIAAYAFAGTVALARVHVGAHLPLDVVAGAALGYGLGWAWNLAVGVPVEVEEAGAPLRVDLS
jgi:glycosyltransferase 2 family protein